MSTSTLPQRVIGRRRFFRFLEWTIKPDREPDAPQQRHVFMCLGEAEDGTKCGADSGEHEDFEQARSWTFQHLKHHQDHRSFSQLSEVPWLMVPKEEPE